MSVAEGRSELRVGVLQRLGGLGRVLAHAGQDLDDLTGSVVEVFVEVLNAFEDWSVTYPPLTSFSTRDLSLSRVPAISDWPLLSLVAAARMSSYVTFTFAVRSNRSLG